MIYLDCETAGLHGMAVLLQYAIDDGPVVLYDIWQEPIGKTLDLIESFATHGSNNTTDGIVGFNIAFDWFHLCKLHTTFSLMEDRSKLPVNCIEELALLEEKARDGDCLKPVRACDLMLHARKGPYQSTMDRKTIRIRRVPTALAGALADELETRVPLKDIYFSRRKDKKARHWKISEIKGNPDFKTLELKFAASSALKAICADAFNRGEDARLLFRDVELNRKYNPVEKGYAPFALATGKPGKWNWAWPEVITHHIDHWGYNSLAREYAEADVLDTRALYKHFGSPELGDDDSELACMVAASRWRGFSVDVEGLKLAKIEAQKLIENTPMAPGNVRAWLSQVMSPVELLGAAAGTKQKAFGEVRISTKKVVLEELATYFKECETCEGKGYVKQRKKHSVLKRSESSSVLLSAPDSEEEEGTGPTCPDCDGVKFFVHPVAERAKQVLAARKAKKEIELYDKIILAGRFHASFKVIGTLSSRMSGSDGLNPQAINKRKEVRQHFKLAQAGYVLCGGDFKGFEVSLAEAVYSSYVKEGQSSKFRADLLSGKKVHALFGQFCYPGETYESIVASDGSAFDMYTRAKSGFFALIYGGNEQTLVTRLGVSLEAAQHGYAMFTEEYPEVGEARKNIFNMFCSMRQPIPMGKVEWHEPAEYIETALGFRRYFTLENSICKALYELGQKPPKEWRNLKIKVVRSDRLQTASGAVQSALFGAAFGVQGANMRAGANHVIQGWGAGITKKVQRNIWNLQPAGVSKWLVQPMNIHDEIECPTSPELTEQVKDVVESTVESFRPTVPLIGIGWKTGLKDWSSK